MATSRKARITADTETFQPKENGWPEWIDPTAAARLREAIRGDRIGHAYLFFGPKGVGKSALASAFAKALCCPNRAADDRSKPCGVCRVCRNVSRHAHPDVEHFDLKSQAALAEKPGRNANLNIDTIRGLRASAALLPLESDRRLLIIDDAETLLEPAQQALLKTLEEPPGKVTVVLLADEPEALLDTVRSRCQEIPVRPVAQSVIERSLRQKGVDGELASEVAALSRGCADWALTAVIDKKLLQARREEQDAAAAWINSGRYEQLVTAFKLGDQFAKRRSEVIGIVQAAVQLLREEMIASAQRSSSMSEPVAPGDLKSAESKATALLISRAVAASLRCLSDLESNVRPRLALEVMVMAWPSSEAQRN